VLNVLVAVGLSIAVSGWLLRSRAGGVLGQGQATRWLHQGLMATLVVLGTSSYASRRVLGRRSALVDPSRRGRVFFWSHVLPAILAALAAPLGLAYGWFIVPDLAAIIPFWIVPLALGVLALPRAAELTEFDQPMPDAGASPR
jgi:hypothetical protein